MKKAILILSLCAIVLSGCGTKTETINNNHAQYIAAGRYYTDGNIITDDGNVWNYQTETISDEVSYDNEPVYVVFDNNGTETDIYDDVVVGLMLDRETAIYDELEKSLSSEFALEREGNNIRIVKTNQ